VKKTRTVAATRPESARAAERRAKDAVRTAAAVTVPAQAPRPIAAPVSEPIGTEGPVSYQDAEAAWLASDWPRAAELFGRYGEGKPSNPWGHYMLGLALRQTADFAGAEAAFEAALEIAPNHAKSGINLARTRLEAGRPADAESTAAAVVAAHPGNGDALRVLARALHSLGRADEALVTYDAALAVAPGDAWALNNRGLILIEQERFGEAVAPLEKACALGTEQAVFHNNLGVALERMGRWRAAEEAFARAVELDPGYGKAVASLARVEGLGGEMDEPRLATSGGSPKTEAPGPDPATAGGARLVASGEGVPTDDEPR
jgi:Flp pilus assembly protein TadD